MGSDYQSSGDEGGFRVPDYSEDYYSDYEDEENENSDEEYDSEADLTMKSESKKVENS